MSAHSEPSRDAVVALYTRLLESWSARGAAAFGAQFATNGTSAGLHLDAS